MATPQWANHLLNDDLNLKNVKLSVCICLNVRYI